LSPTQVVAFSSLLDQLSVDLIVRIVEEASGQRGGLDLRALTEDLAREELLRFGRGTRQQVSEKLRSLLTKSGPGFWLNRLVQVTMFHQVERPGHISTPRELEIDSLPYKLIGWLIDVENDLGIDERDPLRYEVRAIQCHPAKKAVTALNLEFVYNDQVRWIEASHRKTAFIYEAWEDTRGDEYNERLRSDKTVRSSGWRLRADKEALRTFLNEMGLDLIVEIAITRRNKGDDYARYDEETAKEARFDRVILLWRDGTIEAAEGCLGTWTAPRA
jgi:hypothetical protein